MSYGVFRLNRCYVGPKVLIISAEEHAYFIREETGWYMRDDFGDETPVFSRDEKPTYTTSTKNNAASESFSACEQLQIEYGTVGRERGIAEEIHPYGSANVFTEPASTRKLLTESGTAHDSVSVILEGGEDS